jgi:next-to-BRCA1 protein 1
MCYSLEPSLTSCLQLRHCLNIKPEQHAVFERFSDSAGGYIILESTNQQVFKTLIRAAKAKSKLRLKATVTPDPASVTPEVTEEKTEDMASTQDSQDTTAEKPVEPVIVRSPENQASARDSTALDGRSIGSGIFQFREARASQQTLVESDAPTPRPFSSDCSEFFNALARAGGNAAPRELAFRSREPAATPAVCAQGQWSVYCNNCDNAMYDAHYHCSICDGGDYDLCETCIASGQLCPGEGHWLIKRSIKDGKVVTSTTERIGRKAEYIKDEVSREMVDCAGMCSTVEKDIKTEVPGAFEEKAKTLAEEPRMPTRTCNNCVDVLPEHQFVTCTTCDDFDLCVSCHTANKHGHHPAHGFQLATEDTVLSKFAEAALAPGRFVRHNAICDGCDKTIFGIRHKCLDCPDWDYCSSCVAQASLKHARHRFTPIYNPIAEPQPVFIRHAGIYCDGPLCRNQVDQPYITGVRYKCAVCHDTDFCASCEALPSNHHNRTHPLIKFKTAVKNVSITTMNEDARGHVRNMGDKNLTSAAPSPPATNTASEVKTVAEIKPEAKVEEKTQPIPVVKPEPKVQLPQALNTSPALLSAAFVKDSISDGTPVPPGARFTQIWTLKNDGAYSWPAGCSVRYVGGDNMLNVDNSHPASITDFNDATESNVVGREVEVGEEIAFKLVLKAPMREGKAISYWRLKSADGTAFGHRLWCDIEVKQPEPVRSHLIDEDETEAQHQHRKQQHRQAQINIRAKREAQVQAAMQANTQAYRTAQAEALARVQLQAQQQAQYQAQQHAQYQALQQHHQQAAEKQAAQEHEQQQFQQQLRRNWESMRPANNVQYSTPAQQAPATQQPSSSAAVDLNPQKETAKLRVEQIKARILKTRAEKLSRDVKAARVAADKKGLEEATKRSMMEKEKNEKAIKMIIDAVTKAPADEAEDLATSQMVFPTLEKESPEASIIQSSSGSGKGKAAYVQDEEVEEAATVAPVEAAPSVASPLSVAVDDEFVDDFDDLEVLSANEESGDDGFLTDEEYDILDASDQETVASK